MTPEEDLAALLSSLGDTHQAVAATLRDGGHRGLRLSGTMCPVSLCAEGRVGLPVFVTAERCLFAMPGGGQVSCDTPAAVAFFIGHFDSGGYPELDAAVGECVEP